MDAGPLQGHGIAWLVPELLRHRVLWGWQEARPCVFCSLFLETRGNLTICFGPQKGAGKPQPRCGCRAVWKILAFLLKMQTC